MSRARPGKLPCGHDTFVDAPDDPSHDDNSNQVACCLCFAASREETAKLTEERNKLLFPIDSYACQQCGRRDGLDAGVTDEVWAKLSAAAGGVNLLCLWCMDELATQLEISASVMLWFAGRALSGSEGPTTWDDNELSDALLESQTRTVQAVAERDASRTLVAAKDKALGKYAIHEDGCLGRKHGDCDCGLNDALALTEKEMTG